MIIANGLHLNPISQIEKKDNCTWFISKTSVQESGDVMAYMGNGDFSASFSLFFAFSVFLQR